MNKLKEKLNIQKERSFHESNSLETMLLDSLYLAWPVASLRVCGRQNRHLHRRADAIEQELDLRYLFFIGQC